MRSALAGLALTIGACSVPAKQPGVGDAGADASAPDAAPTEVPETTITAAPPAFSGAAAATFEFTSNLAAVTFLCRIDGGAPVACASPFTRQLADGGHSFAVRAIGAADAGDASAAEHLWTIDTLVPTTTLVEAPPVADNSTEVMFRFRASEESVVFECSLDSAPYAACASGAPVGPIGDGTHAFAVRARDRAGNVDASPAIHAWSVDTSTPDTQILTAPQPAVSSTSALFTFISPDAGAGARFECALDGAPFVACTSPHQLTGLAMGDHTLAVRVRDLVGNVDPSPALRRWTVDVAAPDTTITTGPAGLVAIASAAFTFTASEPDATFTCALDGAPAMACSSPFTVAGLAQGEHALQITARDTAGNEDASPAVRTWTVDTVAPALTITDGPAEGAVVGPRVVVAYATAEGAVTCVLDGAALPGCTSPIAINLPDGVHTLVLTARDGAGNTMTATRSFTVDCHAPDEVGAVGLLHLDALAQELPNAVPGGAPAILGDDGTPELVDPAMAAGRYGDGLRFTAAEGDRVSWPLALGATTALTVELYARPTVSSGARDLVTTGDGRVAVRVTAASATTVQMALVVLDTSGAPIVVSSAPVAAERWHHVVATWAEPSLTLWVDGARTDMPGLVLGAPVSLDAVRLGGAAGAAYEGALDEVWLGAAVSDDTFALGRYCPSGG